VHPVGFLLVVVTVAFVCAHHSIAILTSSSGYRQRSSLQQGHALDPNQMKNNNNLLAYLLFLFLFVDCISFSHRDDLLILIP
jgi:hypothetical protein